MGTSRAGEDAVEEQPSPDCSQVHCLMDILLMEMKITYEFEIHSPHHIVIFRDHARSEVLSPYSSLHSPYVSIRCHECRNFHSNTIQSSIAAF